MKFKLLAGRHRQGSRTYIPGDIIETEKLLTEMFANKFERVPDNTPATADADAVESEAKEEAEEDAEDEVDMVDVSESFSGVPEDHEVLQHPETKEYFVYHGDDSTGPFNSKKQVIAHLKTL